ncbi:MAG: SMC-Scp complex subunit ScpB [Thermoleophilia bacterium]
MDQADMNIDAETKEPLADEPLVDGGVDDSTDEGAVTSGGADEGEAPGDADAGAAADAGGDEDEGSAGEAVPEVSAPAPEREPAADADPLMRDIEAILFVSPEPVSLEVLAEVTGVEGEELSLAVESVRDKFSGATGGIVFTEVAGGYSFRASDQALPAVERLCQRPADYTLSAAAMETLAIIAYLQPISRPEIARIRGIGADTVVANLLEKGLLEESGRARDTGAVKYRTTRVFEKLFGLAEVSELPAVEGFDATPQDVEELRQKLHLAADKRQ